MTQNIWETIKTPMGVRIRVGRPEEIFGDGVTMIVDFNSGDRVRATEVMLDPDSVMGLIEALRKFEAK